MRHQDQQGDWYLIPGGGQHPGETLPEALQRECAEEIGTTVEVGDLCLVREYRSANHEFAAQDPTFHQVELFFVCTVPADYVPHCGAGADPGQVGVAWLPLADLTRYRLYPKLFQTLLAHGLPTGGVRYLGDIN